MPPRITSLIAQLLLLVDDLIDQLAAQDLLPSAWRDQFAAALTRYHAAAYLVGADAPTLTGPAQRTVVGAVATQLRFLDRFTVEVQDAPAFQAGWRSRAAMYAEGIGASYWRGATRMLPLPFMPRDGTTQCLTHCHCSWTITQLEGDGNYDCTWQLGGAEHCQTCVARAMHNPYQIRDGVLL